MPSPNPHEQFTNDPRKLRVSTKNDVQFYDPVHHNRPEEVASVNPAQTVRLNTNSMDRPRRPNVSTSDNNVGLGRGLKYDDRQSMQPYPQYPQEQRPLRQDLDPLRQHQTPGSSASLNRQQPGQRFQQQSQNAKPQVVARGVENIKNPSRNQGAHQDLSSLSANAAQQAKPDRSNTTVINGQDFKYFLVPGYVEEMEVTIETESASAISALVELVQEGPGRNTKTKIEDVSSDNGHAKAYRTTVKTPSKFPDGYAATKTSISISNTASADHPILVTIRPLTSGTGEKTQDTTTSKTAPGSTAGTTSSYTNQRGTGQTNVRPNLQMQSTWKSAFK